jgi:hypothetical protein
MLSVPPVTRACRILRIWRVVTNVLNKQSRTGDNGLTTPYRKKTSFLTIGPRTWTCSLYKRPKLRKMDTTFGAWIVRSLSGSLVTVAREIGWYYMDWIHLGQDRDSVGLL